MRKEKIQIDRKREREAITSIWTDQTTDLAKIRNIRNMDQDNDWEDNDWENNEEWPDLVCLIRFWDWNWILTLIYFRKLSASKEPPKKKKNFPQQTTDWSDNRSSSSASNNFFNDEYLRQAHPYFESADAQPKVKILARKCTVDHYFHTLLWTMLYFVAHLPSSSFSKHRYELRWLSIAIKWRFIT